MRAECVDNAHMTAEFTSVEICEACKGTVSRERACHFYRAGVSITLCSPQCAQDFLLGEGRNFNGQRRTSVLEELLTEQRW